MSQKKQKNLLKPKQQKINYEVVKEHIGRARVGYSYRVIFLPQLTRAQPGTEEFDRWTVENNHLVNFQVLAHNKPLAQELAMELYERWKLVEDADDPDIVRILYELEKLRAKEISQFTAVERWTWNALNMSEYSGNANLMCLMSKVLSNYSGRVLEVFCGHNSYFVTKKGRTIVALDYCRQSLTQFCHKSAKRICCDLNQVKSVGDLSFFDDESFDVISICFGYKYPDDIDILMSEFRRILKPDGILSFIESYTHGYREIMQRTFDKDVIRKKLRSAGFSKVSVRPINQTPGKLRRRKEDLVYHAQAFK